MAKYAVIFTRTIFVEAVSESNAKFEGISKFLDEALTNQVDIAQYKVSSEIIPRLLDEEDMVVGHS